MNTKIIGTFVLTDAGNGCLTSKYVNTGMDSPFVEACKLESEGTTDPFFGNFKTVWIEDFNQSEFTDLRIQYQEGSNESIYSLEWWTIKSPRLIFSGIGMIYQENLVGAYWSE